jgi:hypothetical protein
MAFFTFSHRLGTSFAVYRVRLKMTVIFTYTTIFSIPLFSRLPCPETIFFSRKNRDPERRCYMSSVIIKGPDIILFN